MRKREKKVKKWRKMCHVITNQKKAGVAILTLDNGDFRARKMTRDKGD
jgi:hypothetical protein